MNFLTGPTAKPRTCPMSSGGIGMVSRLDEALATLTPTQIRRLNARFGEGKKFREIAEAEGIDTSIAHHSVRDAVLKLQKYFIKHGWMKPPKEKSICTKISPPKRQRKKQNKKKL